MKKIAKKMMAVLLVVILVMSPFPELRTRVYAEDVLTIASIEDWNAFAQSVKDGNTYSGKTVNLTTDLEEVTTMVNGVFSGTFDGNGHSVTMNIEGGQVALFKNVVNGTIKNMTLGGTVRGTGNHCAALVQSTEYNSASTCTISNVIVNASVISSAPYIGGFVGHGGGSNYFSGAKVIINNCEFNGSLIKTGGSALHTGTAVGWCQYNFDLTVDGFVFGGHYSNTGCFNMVGIKYFGYQGWSNNYVTSNFKSNTALQIGSATNNAAHISVPSSYGTIKARVQNGGTVTDYSDFESAYAAWTTGTTLILMDDANISNKITVSDSRTLDLHGHGIRMMGSDSVFQIDDGGLLTIRDTIPWSPNIITLSEGRGTGYAPGIASEESASTRNIDGGFITGGAGAKAGAISINSGGAVDMSGGTIIGNISTNGSGTSAGGVLIEDGGTFTMTGGTIMYNNASSSEGAGGVCVSGSSAVLNAEGKVIVTDNTKSGSSVSNVWLASEKKINISGALDEEALIGVTTVDVPTGTAPVIFTDGLNSEDTSNFTSDNDNYTVYHKDNEAALFVKLRVDFNMNGHGVAVNYQMIEVGNKVTKPDDPEEDGYDFEGWYKEEGYTNPWDFDEIIIEDTTLYAKWTVNEYEIQYDLGGGEVETANPTVYTVESEDITLNNPVKSGYDFDGWTGTGLDSASKTVTIASGSTGDRSYTATWKVIPATAPTIKAQPDDLELEYGYTDGSISISVEEATDTAYTLSYQWYSNTTESNSDGTEIEGATEPDYTIPTGKTVGTTEYYYCVVTAVRSDNSETISVPSDVATVTVKKAEGSEPEEAVINVQSSDAVCIDAEEDQEYVIVKKGEEPDWSEAVTADEDGLVNFENLEPYTEYDIYTRKKETSNTYAGEAVKTPLFTDLEDYSVDGDTYVGETLTVITNPEDVEGLTYKWHYVNVVEEGEGYRQTELGDAIEGAEGASYTLTNEDYGKYICVVIYRNGELYDVSSDYGPIEYNPDDIFYVNVEGDGAEWTKGSGVDLKMIFKRSVVDSETFEHFTGILVDGVAVDPSDYTAESGSVVINLKASYLEELTVGKHVLTAQFDDADDVDASFTVKEEKKSEDTDEEEKSSDETARDADIKPADTSAADNSADAEKAADDKSDDPKTGDEANPQLMLLVMLLAAIDMALVAFIRSKKREN